MVILSSERLHTKLKKGLISEQEYDDLVDEIA